MPELPEVETVVRALRPHLLGRCVTTVHVRARRLRVPVEIHRVPQIRHSRIVDLRRRAKYIIAELENQWAIRVHLGMTGRCRIRPAAEPHSAYEHVIWDLDDGHSWRFADVRRFGTVDAHLLPAPGGQPSAMDVFGLEPLDGGFDALYLERISNGRRRPIKNLIMDQHVVVGVGNIYASEALFRAGIRPDREAASLSRARLERLVAAIKTVLTAAIAAGGTTIIDFQSPDGQEGYFARELQVYDRAGERCLVCQRGEIRRYVLAGRSSYYCPVCQR